MGQRTFLGKLSHLPLKKHTPCYFGMQCYRPYSEVYSLSFSPLIPSHARQRRADPTNQPAPLLRTRPGGHGVLGVRLPLPREPPSAPAGLVHEWVLHTLAGIR